jgi:regulator of protease activity HflC (stomatin/prohibitin superfamily)
MFALLIDVVLAVGVFIGLGVAGTALAQNEGKKSSVLGWVGGFFVGLIVFAILSLFNAVVLVNAGEVGVVTQFGAVTGAQFEQGLHFKVPYIQGVNTFDVRTQKDQVEAEAASQDLQTVHSTVAINYHLEAAKAGTVFREIGIEYKSRVLDPAVQEAFKFTTAQFTAEQLITQREAVKNKALGFLKERMAKVHIVIDEFNIVNFDFSVEFNTAIEAKQVAQQNVEKAKRDLERITVEAQQKVAEARGTAESQALLRPNLTPEYLNYLAVNKWNGVLPQATNGLPFLQLPVNK